MKKIIFSIVVLLSGCSSDFTPNGPYQQRLVVYAVLDGNTSTQFIRVYGSFSPNEYDPLQPSPNKEIYNASVTVDDGQSTYVFHDTTINVPTNGAGSRSVHAYVNYVLQAEEKKQYTATVAAKGFDTSKAVFKSISPGRILLSGSHASLIKPADEKTIVISISLGENVQAFLPMIFFEYEVNNDSLIRTREVPMKVLTSDFSDELTKIYPSIMLRSKSSDIIDPRETIVFNTDAYISTIIDIRKEHPNLKVKFKRALLKLVQFDNDLYTYYSIVNNFGGSSSLRLDEPDYTNFQNGFGVFGMYNSQIEAHVLPVDF